MKAISVIIKPVSGECNLNCKYCFYLDEIKNRKIRSYGRMSDETLEQIIKKAMKYVQESVSFAFQGGEPTLAGTDFYKKVLYFQKKYNTRKIRIENSIQTNGVLLDEEWIQFFAKNKFLVGVSIDGLEEIHDSLRKDKRDEGTYQKINYVLEQLEKNKVMYNVLTVVTNDLTKKINEIYDLYKKKNWNYQQYIACLDPLDKEEKEDSPLTEVEYGKFLIELFYLWYEDLKNGKQPYIRQFENYIAMLMGYKAESCEQSGLCGFQVVIEADGSVYPCDFYVLDEYCLGNIHINTMEEILFSPLRRKLIEDSQKISKQCLSCIYFGLCRGGCFRNRRLDSNADYNSRFCLSYQMFFKECLPVMQNIANRSATK